MENTETKKSGFDFNSLDNQTKFILGASILGLISCFLPLLSGKELGDKFGPSLFSGGGYGYFIFIGFLGTLIFNLMGDKLNNHKQLTKIFVVGLGSLWGFLLVILMLASWVQGASPIPIPGSMFDYMGIGFYLTTISIIVLVFSVFDINEKQTN
ncbi:MAG: hypothetical protein JXR58_01470 [Bacteroidales bacterium]|nr:hypothetical protein [Bacteroidales bacterium]